MLLKTPVNLSHTFTFYEFAIEWNNTLIFSLTVQAIYEKIEGEKSLGRKARESVRGLADCDKSSAFRNSDFQDENDISEA